MLGDAVPADAVDRIVEQASGNALFLEELIRAESSGKGGLLPETVIAMLQARIGQLEVDARKVLSAASIFGETFWRGGILARVLEVIAQDTSVGLNVVAASRLGRSD